MKTEGKCRCGAWEHRYKGSAPCAIWHCDWQNRSMVDGHCHVCGDYLHKNGWAYEMVRKGEVIRLRNLIVELAARRFSVDEIKQLIAGPAAEESETDA